MRARSQESGVRSREEELEGSKNGLKVEKVICLNLLLKADPSTIHSHKEYGNEKTGKRILTPAFCLLLKLAFYGHKDDGNIIVSTLFFGGFN